MQRSFLFFLSAALRLQSELPGTSEALWPRLVDDVQRSELKVLRLKARIAKLNLRIDAVLNRTSTTQPLVLSFKDEAVTTGTSASQNNFTIVATKPLLMDSFTKLNTSNVTLTADNASVANDEKELQAMNGLDAMHANVTIYDTELDNLDPVLEDFNNQTVPIEEFFQQSYDTIMRRAVDRSLNDFLGDTMAAMATKLRRSQEQLTPGQN